MQIIKERSVSSYLTKQSDFSIVHNAIRINLYLTNKVR